jgi:hypothetical protein
MSIWYLYRLDQNSRKSKLQKYKSQPQEYMRSQAAPLQHDALKRSTNHQMDYLTGRASNYSTAFLLTRLKLHLREERNSNTRKGNSRRTYRVVVVAVLGALDLRVDDAQEFDVGGGPGRGHRRERHRARLRPRHGGVEGAEKRGTAGRPRGGGPEEGRGGDRGAAAAA